MFVTVDAAVTAFWVYEGLERTTETERVVGEAGSTTGSIYLLWPFLALECGAGVALLAVPQLAMKPEIQNVFVC